MTYLPCFIYFSVRYLAQGASLPQVFTPSVLLVRRTAVPYLLISKICGINHADCVVVYPTFMYGEGTMLSIVHSNRNEEWAQRDF